MRRLLSRGWERLTHAARCVMGLLIIIVLLPWLVLLGAAAEMEDRKYRRQMECDILEVC